ncbi:ATP-binding protein [Streptomyces sp. NPDC090022]|uniref:ATP-binding protein n=1 Tax=Streptomyces sp. NPDC090022 TaxID=3365920 RepID=UPI0037F66F05
MSALTPPLTYRLVAPSRADTPRLARDWVTLVLRAAGQDRLVERARLCTSEVVTNAHQHTATPEIGVEVLLQGDVVTVYVYDSAPDRWPAGGGGLFDTCGRGLDLVRAYADDWSVVMLDDGTAKAVWFSLGSRE